MAIRAVNDAERRARLGRRHLLAPARAGAGLLDAARAVVALHSTDPASMTVSVLARAPRRASPTSRARSTRIAR